MIEPVADLRRAPSHEAPLDTQALMGERVTVYEMSEEGWAWGQLASDGYVGWLSANALTAPGPAPTHKVAALRTLAFPAPDIKMPPLAGLPLGARVAVARQDDRFAVTAAGWHIPQAHLAPIEAERAGLRRGGREIPRHALSVGRQDLARPRLLRPAASRHAGCGQPCPRDTDLQELDLGVRLAFSELRRGDLIFWKGHVALARDGGTLIHANAFHMAVASEPVAQALARIKAAGSEVTSVRRLG